MFNGMPFWFAALNAIALGIGYTVLLFCLCKAVRPLLRGLSYGLYETVMYYKAGADLGRVFTRFLHAITIDFVAWGALNTHTESITNNMAGWYGIFSWYFSAELNRADMKRANAEERNKPKTEPVETADIDDGFGDDIDDDIGVQK